MFKRYILSLRNWHVPEETLTLLLAKEEMDTRRTTCFLPFLQIILEAQNYSLTLFLNEKIKSTFKIKNERKLMDGKLSLYSDAIT